MTRTAANNQATPVPEEQIVLLPPWTAIVCGNANWRAVPDLGRLVERRSMTTSTPETFVYEDSHGMRTMITVSP